LLNNIYGVDIDRQAVEVTKLSLLLKVLEGENEETLEKQLKLFQERALPDLGNNIKCGNSLIGWDILKDNPGMAQEEIDLINPFDWEREFPEIFQNGGFSVVIGNPPYVRHGLLSDMRVYFQQHYQTYRGIADLYVCFIERGISLLKNDGVFSYIVANKWMRAKYGEPLRRWLKTQHIDEIIDFGDLPVFQGATTYPCIIRTYKRAPITNFRVTQVENLDFANLNDYVKEHSYYINQAALDDSCWTLADENTQALLNKLRSKGIPLGEFVNGKIYLGVLTDLDKAFIIDELTRNRLIAEDPRSAEVIKPFLMGRYIKRYQPPVSDKYLIFMPKGWTHKKISGSSDTLGWLMKNYPAIANHLLPFTDAAAKRDSSNRGEYWWELRSCEYYDEFEKPKILWPEIAGSARFAFDESGAYTNHKVYLIPGARYYLLGLLNSSLLRLFIHSVCTDLQGDSFNFSVAFVRRTPIRTIDFTDPADAARHDRIVSLVEQMHSLHKQLLEARTPHEKTALQRQIDATDRQIDALVYELYGLTEEEIRIVEGI
jgi:hypothetical protein